MARGNYLDCKFGEYHCPSMVSPLQKTLLRKMASARLSCGIVRKTSRRLELSVLKDIPHGRWGRGPGSVDPGFPAGLPFPVPEILELVAFRDSGKLFQQFSRDFPGVFLENPRTDPGNSHIRCSIPWPFFSRELCRKAPNLGANRKVGQ